MAGLNIGDVFMRVVADMSGFEADVTKQAGAAGDKAGKTLGQRMKAGMSAGLTAVGAAGGAVLAVATRGAAELTDAMAGFAAETGATQAELESARKSVLELSKTNLQSFDEIAKAQAALRTDLGLTQEQAEQATGAFLDYATATGQDAAEGVRAFDDILDAWNLDAEDATGIMDKLIKSHQEFGGSIKDNQQTLADLAPSLQAANLSIDDGIGLLNMFQSAGIDAAAATTGMTKALGKVKSPEELQALIADIAGTEDPFLRAQKAIELFGTKAGPKLAQALAGNDLSDFTISMDEATGATERAAEAIENTPLNQFKLALRGIVSPAIEAGQAFGPLILALSQLGGGKLLTGVFSALGGLGGFLTSKLGPKLATAGGKLGTKLMAGLMATLVSDAAVSGIGDALGSSVSKAATSGGLKNALSSLGGKLGLSLGTGLALGAAGIAITVLLQELDKNVQRNREQLQSIGKSVANEVTTGTVDQLRQSKAALEKGISDLNGVFDFGFQSNEARAGLQAQLDAVNAEIAKRAGDGGMGAAKAAAEGFADGLKAGQPAVENAATTVANAAGVRFGRLPEEAEATGAATTKAYADGVRDARDKVSSAIAALREALKNELSPAKERARVIGELTSKELAKGLKSKDPVVRQAAQDAKQTLLTRLSELTGETGKLGKKTGEELAKALKSKDPDIRAAARKVKETIEAKLRETDGKKLGRAIGEGINDGLGSKKGKIGATARSIARKIGKDIVTGMTIYIGRQVPEPKAAGGPVAARQTYLVGERGPELFTPNVGGKIDNAAKTAGLVGDMAAAGGDITINLQTYGLPMRAETPAEVVHRIRRATRLGIVAPPRRAPAWSTN